LEYFSFFIGNIFDVEHATCVENNIRNSERNPVLFRLNLRIWNICFHLNLLHVLET
jgi:hypothetical protein